MDGTKPGWKTSEFYITILGSLSAFVAAHQGAIPQPWGIVAVTVLGAAYTISRAITKSGAQ